LRIRIYIYAFCTIFQCEVNYNVCSGIRLTCFGSFECVYTFCVVFPCKFNYNICLMIKMTDFGNCQNKYIVICILYLGGVGHCYAWLVWVPCFIHFIYTHMLCTHHDIFVFFYHILYFRYTVYGHKQVNHYSRSIVVCSLNTAVCDL
jgi:hypothetical protein